ncbi:retrotransposon protein, putative, ty1-copia subclass [Tanacetum coccineum]
MVRSMMSRATLPISFWGYALETAAHILNLVPTKKVSKTPFEMWKGKRPSLGHIKIWGCEVFVRREAQDKLEARFEKCLFVGYPEESFGYLFYKPKDNVIDLEEIQESADEEPIVNTDTQQEMMTPVKPDDISLPICRTSGRVSKPPQFYYCFYIEEDKISDSTLSELDKPANYKEAMASPEAVKWKEAMKSKIQSMYDNQVWNLVDTTPSLKTVECKWIFQKKTDKDGKVHTYKARSKHLIGLSQDTYLDKILKRFKLENSKKWNLPLHHGIKISKDLCPKTDEELDRMSQVLYASVVGSIMYAMTCTRPDVSFALSMVNRFLVYGGKEELRVTGYCDASWQIDKDNSRSQSGWVFLLNGGAVTRQSSKQDTVADSTCKSEYIAACEASKEAI